MRRTLLIALSVLLLLTLASCGAKAPTAKDIQIALSENMSFLPWAEITSVTIDRSQTEEKAFTADVSFTAVDDYADYTGTATVYYNLYDGGRWMMDKYDDIFYNTICREKPDDESLLSMAIMECLSNKVLGDEANFDADTHRGSTPYFPIANPTDIDEATKILWWLIEWPVDGDSKHIEISAEWRERRGYVSAACTGTVSFNFSNGEWRCIGADNIKGHPKLLDLSYHWPMDNATLIYANIFEVRLEFEGTEYSFFNTDQDCLTAEYTDKILQKDKIEYRAAEGLFLPVKYGYMYSTHEFNKLALEDLFTDYVQVTLEDSGNDFYYRFKHQAD